MRTALLTAALCTLCWMTPARAEPAGLAAAGTAQASATDTPSSSILDWGRTQGRVAFATNATPLRADAFSADSAFKVSSISLMGDYYLRPSLNQLTLSGLRATSGLVLGQRSTPWGVSSGQYGAHTGGGAIDRRAGGMGYAHDNFNHVEHSSTMPYVGIGYTGGGSSKSSSWGFSADLGLMSLSPGNIARLGKVMNGSQNLDDMVRDLRLSPVLQFGFTYAF